MYTKKSQLSAQVSLLCASNKAIRTLEQLKNSIK